MNASERRIRARDTTGKVRVLVVDDSADHAEVLANLFRGAGFEARVAYNGELALSVVHEFEPHCVMLDVHMPYMDGHELAQMLRTHFVDDIVLIGMSGHPPDDAAVAGAIALVDHYFQKPVDFAAIERVLPSLKS